MAQEVMLVEDIRAQLAWEYKFGKHVAGTVELLGASFIADEDLIFGKQDNYYVQRELEWYMSRSLEVKDIPGVTPKIWEQVSSEKGEINSNYGYLVFGKENGNQYGNVLRTLRTAPNGRRAVAIYTRPSMQIDWNRDGMADFVCTNAVHYNIRDNKLHVIVQMRSNDAVFGYKNDLAWQKFVQRKIIGDLTDTHPGLQAGDIIWQAASLHVYERHFHLLDHFWHTGYISINKDTYNQMYGVS